MTVKLGMTHAQLIASINSDIDLIKDQGSKIITKEFPASETEISSVQLDTKCQGKDYMFVFMDYGILEPSKYSLSADGLTVNFSPAIPANHKLLVRYFSYINLATIPNGLFLGQIIQVPFGIDESKNIGRYLNGQVIIQEQFPAFTTEVKSWVSTRPSLFTTEENWQAEKTNSKLGQCGKFVVDDTAGTIRLPAVVNAQGLVDLALIGGIKSESLPNITGNVGCVGYDRNAPTFKHPSGAFYEESVVSTTIGYEIKSVWNTGVSAIDASRSSSAYQDNAPVQQEAVQYPYCIVVNTGVEESDRPINDYQVNNVYSYGMSQYYKGTMNNNSWLKSAGQWNAGTVYTGMYNWLLEQMNAGVSGFVASTAAYTDYDFVINTTDQTFRLPLKNGQEGVFADGVKGNGMTLGLLANSSNAGLYTVRTGDLVYLAGIQKAYGKSQGQTLTTEAWNRTSNSVGVTTDPSKSGMIVDKTVPSGWNLYYYIGDTLQNAQLVNVARIEETLVNKTNKVQAAEASMPSGRYIDLTLGASGSTYTAPANGWFFASGNWAPDGRLFNVTMDVSAYGVQASTGISGPIFFRVLCPVVKGAIMTMSYTLATIVNFRFIYAEGESNV